MSDGIGRTSTHQPHAGLRSQLCCEVPGIGDSVIQSSDATCVSPWQRAVTFLWGRFTTHTCDMIVGSFLKVPPPPPRDSGSQNHMLGRTGHLLQGLLRRTSQLWPQRSHFCFLIKDPWDSRCKGVLDIHSYCKPSL